MSGSQMAPFLGMEQRHALSHEQGLVVNFIQEQSLADIQSMLESLVQRGEIEINLLPDFDDEDRQEGTDNLDAEWSLADEDALRVDDYPMTDEIPYASGKEFEIRVIIDEHGNVKCIPPANEWSSAKSSRYKKVLNGLNGRYKTFEAIAQWLELNERELLLNGVDFFLGNHEKMERKDFAEEFDIGEPALCRHIQNAYLSWEDASIPLRELFVERGKAK